MPRRNSGLGDHSPATKMVRRYASRRGAIYPRQLDQPIRWLNVGQDSHQGIDIRALKPYRWLGRRTGVLLRSVQPQTDRGPDHLESDVAGQVDVVEATLGQELAGARAQPWCDDSDGWVIHHRADKG